jgi:hypothetical protein
MKRIRWVLPSLLAAVVLVGCAPDGDGRGTDPADDATPPAGESAPANNPYDY